MEERETSLRGYINEDEKTTAYIFRPEHLRFEAIQFIISHAMELGNKGKWQMELRRLVHVDDLDELRTVIFTPEMFEAARNFTPEQQVPFMDSMALCIWGAQTVTLRNIDSIQTIFPEEAHDDQTPFLQNGRNESVQEDVI